MSASTAPDSSGARDCPVCSADDASALAAAGPDGHCPACGRKVPVGRDHAELDLGLLAGVTDRGLRHSRNEDAMALATADGPDGPVALAVVSDGVSSAPRRDAGVVERRQGGRGPGGRRDGRRAGGRPGAERDGRPRRLTRHDLRVRDGRPRGRHGVLARRQPGLLADRRPRRLRPSHQGRLARRRGRRGRPRQRGRGDGLPAGARDHPVARGRPPRPAAARRAVRPARGRGGAALLRRPVELSPGGGRPGRARVAWRADRPAHDGRRPGEVRHGHGRRGQHHRGPHPVPCRRRLARLPAAGLSRSSASKTGICAWIALSREVAASGNPPETQPIGSVRVRTLMLEALVIAGIVAAPLGSAALFLPGRRYRRVAGPWPATRRFALAVIGTALLAAAAALVLKLLSATGSNLTAGVAGLIVASVIWLPVTRRWSPRAHLCWSSCTFLFVVYLSYALDWTFASNLGPASTAGGVLLWVLEALAALLSVAYLWEICDALGTEDWRRRLTPATAAGSRATPRTGRLPMVSLHVPAHNEPPDMVIDTL